MYIYKYLYIYIYLFTYMHNKIKYVIHILLCQIISPLFVFWLLDLSNCLIPVRKYRCLLSTRYNNLLPESDPYFWPIIFCLWFIWICWSFYNILWFGLNIVQTSRLFAVPFCQCFPTINHVSNLSVKDCPDKSEQSILHLGLIYSPNCLCCDTYFWKTPLCDVTRRTGISLIPVPAE